MYLAILISVSFLSFLVFNAILLPPSLPLDNSLQPPQPPSNLILTNNINDTTLPPSNVLRIQCDANYGRNLHPGSCLDVFRFIGGNEEEGTFSQRHTGHPSDIPLPLRFLSNDGLCFVQPQVEEGYLSGRASAKQIAQAAYTLQQKCVVERSGLGGIARNIGMSSSNLQYSIYYQE